MLFAAHLLIVLVFLLFPFLSIYGSCFLLWKYDCHAKDGVAESKTSCLFQILSHIHKWLQAVLVWGKLYWDMYIFVNSSSCFDLIIQHFFVPCGLSYFTFCCNIRQRRAPNPVKNERTMTKVLVVSSFGLDWYKARAKLIYLYRLCHHQLFALQMWKEQYFCHAFLVCDIITS